MYKDFVRDAIESADHYYASANTMKHSRIEIRVLGIQKTAADLYVLSLSQKLKHAEMACLCIESYLMEPDWYEDHHNHFVSRSLFNVIQTGDEKATVTVEIKKPLLNVFEDLRPDELLFVSDLKFLIRNVEKWYSKYGHFIHCPPPPSLSEKDFYIRGMESDQQKEAIKTALTSNISYIWGAPGTGKTQFVLANCIISYIKKGKQVLVLAPTNNAIEQTLRAIIEALKEQGQDINCLYRLGTSSETFAREYGSICERIDQTTKIEELKNSIEALTKRMENAARAKMVLCFYEEFRRHADQCNENKSFERHLFEKCEELRGKWKQVIEEIPAFEKTATDIKARERAISARETSLSFKIKKTFTQTEANALEEEKELLSVRLTAARTKIAELQNQSEAIYNTLKSTEKEHEQASADTRRAYVAAMNIAGKVFLNEKFPSLDIVSHRFAELASSLADVPIDDSLLEQIEQKERLLKALTENVSKNLEGKLVFAFTVDYFFAHYKSLAEVGIRSALVSHVFLDEAAYCPLIKSGILYSLDSPVTLLGDHMQLPPICEASDRAIADEETKIFLWDLSAIYFPEIFDSGASLSKLFDRFKLLKSRSKDSVVNLSSLSDENMETAALPYTFRFGNNLAAILDTFVYKNGFTGRTDFDTEITVLHSQKGADSEPRTNRSEAETIRKYILSERPKNYVVMTPYKKQRGLLMKSLSGITAPDNILTVHASQGREWDTVILSVTDTERPYFVNSSLPEGLHTLNTAISRAKKNIVIVCDCDYWRRHENSQLISELVKNATKSPLNV